MIVVCTYFAGAQFSKHQGLILVPSEPFFFLISTVLFEKTTSFISASPSAFSRTYIHRVSLHCSRQTSFTVTNISSFTNEFIFLLLALAGENNREAQESF